MSENENSCLECFPSHEGVLSIRNLSCKAGTFELRNISMTVKSNTYLCVVGATGSGKTVLLEVIAGLRKPLSGTIVFNNDDMTMRVPEERMIGFAYQDSFLYPFLTVRENILFAAKIRKIDKTVKIVERCEELLDRMKIAHLKNRKPKFLSGGERQRVSLARAILLRPRLLLLDEPMSALDEVCRHDMRLLLKEIHKEDACCVIHVTHDRNDVDDLAKTLAVMDAGLLTLQSPASSR